MAAGYYLDKGSVIVRFRQQYNGKTANLHYFPGIIIEDESQFTGGKAPSCTNSVIDKKLTSIKQAVNDVLEENDPFKLTNQTFESLVNDKLKPRKIANKKADPRATKTPFFTYADKYYLELEKEKGYARAKSMNTTIKMLKAYKSNLTFEAIDRDFDKAFANHLEDKKYSKNYIAKMFGNLSRILNHATENRVNSKLDYTQFKHEREEADNVYLNEEQLQTIYDLRFDFSGNWKADFIKYTGTKEISGWTEAQYKQSVQKCVLSLENARKLLIVGCNTGFRVGYFLKINPKVQFSKDKKFITAIGNKGMGVITIPTTAKLRELEASGGWPTPISDHNFNIQIKEIGRIAGFTHIIHYQRTQGGRKESFREPFYKLIKSHTCRRSYCSNLLVSGKMEKSDIMFLSGHKTEQSFNKYTRQVQIDMVAQRLSGADAFK